MPRSLRAGASVPTFLALPTALLALPVTPLAAQVAGDPVPVRISSPDGTLRLEATAEGPWLYARLAAGEYRVEGEFPTGPRAATVVVPAEGRQQLVLTAP